MITEFCKDYTQVELAHYSSLQPWKYGILVGFGVIMMFILKYQNTTKNTNISIFW